MQGKQEEFRETNIWKGVLAGVIGGLAASVVMNQFQKSFSGLITGEKRSHGAQSLQTGAPHAGAGGILEEENAENKNDDAAERLTNLASVELFGYKPSEREKDLGGTAFHYAYGISMGAVYGAAAEFTDKTGAASGLAYGALIWVGADEVVVPMLGLSKSAENYPPEVHAGALASHLVYGLTVEIVRDAVRKIL